MKTDDILLYGGLGLLAYMLLKPKTVAPGVTQVAPVPVASLYHPPAANNAGNTVITALAALAPAAIKYFSPATANNPAAAAAASNASFAPVYNTSTIDTSSLLTDNTPAISYPQSMAFDPTPAEMMFQSGDYPGAEMAGCIGLF